MKTLKARKRSRARSNEDEKFRDKIWTQAEQKKYLQKISFSLPQIEEGSPSAVGTIEDRGGFLDLSGMEMDVLNLKQNQGRVDFETLSYLYLSNNKFETIPTQIFALCPNLVWLDLRRNLLKTFPTSVVNHPNLETILLQQNQLKILPLELGSIPNLSTLLVANNPLEFPNQSIINECETDTNLIDYLKRCWENQSSKDVPILRPELNKGVSQAKKLANHKIKNVRRLSEIVCEKRDSSKIIEQVVAERITNELRSQDAIIQKAKDKETLKTWRDRKKYRDFNGSIELAKIPPPYGIDSNMKMPNRQDLYNTKIDSKEKPKRNSNEFVNIGEEIDQLRKSLLEMVKKRQTDDPGKEMATRLNEIKAIKEIQRKLASLKKLN